MIVPTTLGYGWRSSYWFVTLVVWLGILTDLIVYSIIVPVIPFQLEKLGYTHISTLTGWLMFAYSGGLVITTVFVAMFADNYATRQLPLIVGNIMLIGSQIMFMEAPAYWLMCLARALQGIGSTMVWVVGLALISDVTPKDLIGRQLGIAMSGLTIGILMGPPVGGALYKTFGFRAPFILCIIFAAVDMVGRLLVIEVRPPAATSAGSVDKAENGEASDVDVDTELNSAKQLTFVGAFLALVRSPRALTAGFIALVFGIIAALQDTVVALHLKDVWDADSHKVGLVMLAAVAPTFISTPLTGWAADKKGTAWPTTLSLLLGVPWCGIMIIEGSLGLFITAYALQSFFITGMAAPVTAELAMVAQSIEGVGYAHVYSVFNFAFGLGSTIGPIISGQMYDHITRGWMALCLMVVGLLAVCTALAIIYIGEPSVYQMITGKRRHK